MNWHWHFIIGRIINLILISWENLRPILIFEINFLLIKEYCLIRKLLLLEHLKLLWKLQLSLCSELVGVFSFLRVLEVNIEVLVELWEYWILAAWLNNATVLVVRVRLSVHVGRRHLLVLIALHLGVHWDGHQALLVLLHLSKLVFHCVVIFRVILHGQFWFILKLWY